MGKVLVFTLKGKTAFFKKPDSNDPVYLTYNQPHGVVLRGILGAMLGYRGHIQKREDEHVPEFYDKLRDLKMAVVPLAEKGYFRKKIQQYNNSVGYASKEAGGNLIVKEQWIEDGAWRVFIEDDGSEEFNKVKDRLVNRQATFIPYLGKNDHPAEIVDVDCLDMEPSDEKKVDSLFKVPDKVKLSGELGGSYYAEEYLPVGMDKETNGYVFKKLGWSDRSLEGLEDVWETEKGERISFCM